MAIDGEAKGTPMTEARDVVFLHGAGGPVEAATWLGPLHGRLVQMGYSRFDPDFDRITSPGYREELVLGFGTGFGASWAPDDTSRA